MKINILINPNIPISNLYFTDSPDKLALCYNRQADGISTMTILYPLPFLYQEHLEGNDQRKVLSKAVVLAANLMDHLQKLASGSESREESEYFGNKFKFFYDFLNKTRAKSSLLKIKRQINQMERKINAPKKLRLSYGSFDYADSYFIEMDRRRVMRLIETENGRIHEVRRTKDLDELLYWVFTEITFSMACKEQLERNLNQQDPRIGIFIRQEELLGQLYPHWQDKKHAEYELFMKNHPKDELTDSDPLYCDVLRKLIRAETIEKVPGYFRYS